MDSGIRMIRKRFKCYNCQNKSSKLVESNAHTIQCEICAEMAKEISEEEYQVKTRDQINQNYRMVFGDSNRNEYHNRFDVNDIRKNNLDGESNRKFKNEIKNNDRNSKQSNNANRNNLNK